ncbi:hypothetical protein C0992_008685 [Termitomyces sp. T32_za158]|nr:hypothetical protein C0992_008685 [Termitomyces sp. T32_za158]
MAVENLFPAPSPARSKLTPRTWAGITPESTANVQSLIKESHERWHVFFIRNYRAHNHVIHCALTSWALGADTEIIQAGYDLRCQPLESRFSSPQKISVENFNQHLGDDEYYSAYVDFFTEVVKKQGVISVVEDYVFSEKANFIVGNKEDEQPEMLNRLMDGIVHSMIEIGHGLEFNVPGVVAEVLRGLAWTAVHLKSSSAVIPVSFWTAANKARAASIITRPLGSGGSAVPAPKNNVHALTILARILKDARLDTIQSADYYPIIYSNITDKYGAAITEYVKMWTFDQNDPQEAERKVEELVYANTVIYAVGGWSKDHEFNNDFFYVHLVTSAIFLYQFIEILEPASIEVFLRSYLAVCLTWWIGRGRPGFDIAGFFENVSANPGPVAPFHAPHKDALPRADSPKASNPNPWFRLIQEALVSPDGHLAKTLRALTHFAELYGMRAAGQEDLRTTELSGAELIDGTLFIRAAVLTNERLRKKDVDMRQAKYWDRKGFYETSLESGEKRGYDPNE